jgi:hypothetical protein
MVSHWKPSRKAVKDFIEYHENGLYFYFLENSQKFREKYRGQTIGILDKRIWYSCEDPEEFRRKLREEPRMNQIFVTYVPKENERVFYASTALH